MADQRPARLSAVRHQLVEQHLDGLLISSLPNIRYLSGFSGSNGLLLVTQRDLSFLTDFRYEQQVAEEVGTFARIRIEQSSLWTGLWSQLKEFPEIRSIGFESSSVLHRDFQRLMDEGSRWTWRPVADVVESLRERKDAGEVDAIRQAAEIALAALERTLPHVRAGQTELEIAGILEHHLRDCGSEVLPFPTIAASGPRSALPHARAGSRAIAPGDFLLLDFGAGYAGYCADVTRTVVLGTADSHQREVYDAVRGANEVARTTIRAGLTGKEADAIARDRLAGEGLGDAFGHGLGHGLGLEVHEAPRLSKLSEARLPVGAVVTIEPGVYLPGWGGVRIEDDVFLGPRGPELLTVFPRELIELG